MIKAQQAGQLTRKALRAATTAQINKELKRVSVAIKKSASKGYYAIKVNGYFAESEEFKKQVNEAGFSIRSNQKAIGKGDDMTTITEYHICW